MILLGTKGLENSKLYRQTDKTHLDKGLLFSLWSILKVQTSQLLLVLTLPIHMASSLVLGQLCPAPAEQAAATLLGASLLGFQETAAAQEAARAPSGLQVSSRTTPELMLYLTSCRSNAGLGC